MEPSNTYNVLTMSNLSGFYKASIYNLMQLCDEEFVPPLSKRGKGGNIKTNNKDSSIELYYESVKDDIFEVVLSSVDGGVIAFMSHAPEATITTSFKKYSCDYITTVIVHPEYRSEGIAEKLYQHLLDKAKKRIIVKTWSTNQALICLLEKLNFKLLDTLQNDRGNGIDTVYFVKE